MSDTNVTTAAPRQRRGWLRALVWGCVALLVLLFVGYFVGTSSAFFKGVVLPRVSRALNANVTVSDASISPFRQVVLHHLKVQTTGSEPLISAPEVRLRYSLRQIISGNIQVDEATLSAPIVTLVQNPDGTSNLDPILQAQPGKVQESKPAAPAKPAKAARVDLKKFALTGATIRKVKLYANGNRDLAELSNVNLTLDDLKNGQAGKLGFSADLKLDRHPPAPGAAGSADAKLTGKVDFALSANLKPATVKGNVHLLVNNAQGALGELASFATDLDCEISPAEIKQISLRFARGAAQLGEIRVSGPLDMEKIEGRLALQILSIDQRLLSLTGFNLADWKPFLGDPVSAGTLNAKLNLLSQQGGERMSLTGNMKVENLILKNPKSESAATPLEVGVQVDASWHQHVADIRQFQVALTPTSRAANQLQLTGRVDMSKTNAIQGNLKLRADALDVTGYYDLFAGQQKTTEQPAPSSPSSASQNAPAQAGPEKEPEAKHLPFRNFVAEAGIGRFYLHEVEITNFLATVRIDGGKIVVKPFQLALNGAPVSSEVDLDLGVPGYQYDVSFQARAVPLAPLVNSFQPQRKGQLAGTFTAQASIGGAGTTGASLQKSLAGQFEMGSTNLNLSVVNLKNPVLKLLVNVISTIPDLVRNPAGAAGLLVQGLVGGSSAGGGLADDLNKSPINAMAVRGVIGSGRIDLQEASLQSPAFEAAAQGAITLMPALTNSTIQLPVSISLERSVAQRINLAPAITSTNATYAKLPDFLTITGSLGKPEKSINKTALLGLVTQSLGGSGGKSGNLVQGLGSLLGGKTTASSNAPATQPTTNQNPAANPLNRFLNPKK